MTVEELFAAVRAQLGDDTVPGGAVFTDSVLRPHFEMAWRDIVLAASRMGAPDFTAHLYVVVEPNTGVVDLRALQPDLDSPVEIHEASGLTAVPYSSISSGNPVVVTAPAHGLSDGVIVYLASGTPIDGRWVVSVVDANSFRLNGAKLTASLGPGTLWRTSEQFLRVTLVDELPLPDTQPRSDRLLYASWKDGLLNLQGAAVRVLLRVEYRRNERAPQTGQIEPRILDNYLIYRTAALAAASRGQQQAFASLAALAQAEFDGVRRMLAKQMQAVIWQPKRYRRNPGIIPF